MPRVGSRALDAVAGIYERRSLRVKTPVHAGRLNPWYLDVLRVHKANVHDWEHCTARAVRPCMLKARSSIVELTRLWK